MEYIAEIRADLNGYPGTEKLVMKQGDFNDRYVAVTLTRDGVPVSISDDVTPRVAMGKPDGTQVLADNNIQVLDDGSLKIRIIPQMSTAAGHGQLEIGLYRENTLISTAVIDVLIYPGAVSMLKIASSDEYQALVDALAQIAPAIDAEQKRQAAETERKQQEAIRQSNEAKRQEALSDMLEATEYANNQGDYAKEQGTYAKNQGDYAKEQAAYVQTEFGKVESLLESSENGEILVQVKELLDDMYDVATDTDIDRIIAETYVDEDDEGSIFESGSPEDIDAIIGGSYVEGAEEEDAGLITSSDITEIIDGLFAA